METRITNIQRFCMHDGPGIRTVVFFCGCPLRCQWCHNPETQYAHQIGHPDHSQQSLVPQIIDTTDILSEVCKDQAFYGTDGGITLSGGEPMAQPDAALTLLKEAKKLGLHTVLETCGYFSTSYIPELAKYTDLFLWDYKDSDSHRHRTCTGVSNEQILHNLLLLDQYEVSVILRCILLKGINFHQKHLRSIRELKASLKHCIKVELLPYHPMGESKLKLLGRTNDFHVKKYCLTEEELQQAYRFLESSSEVTL